MLGCIPFGKISLVDKSCMRIATDVQKARRPLAIEAFATRRKLQPMIAHWTKTKDLIAVALGLGGGL